VTSFNGALADVRLSSNARYLSTFAPPASLEVDSNTIGLWHLNEGTGTVVRDASSNSLHGTISGATWSSGGTCVARAPRVDCTSCTAAGTVDGVNNCGPNGNESCGTSLYVPGGTYYRGDTTNYPATISSFRLDKYEVTVGRFRKFVDAWVGGWRPQAGSGKHTHLNGGQGLANTAGGYEPGWNAAWTAYLGAPSTGASAGAIPLAPGAASRADWDAVLACDSTRSTWSTVAGSVERKPINCITWYEALAYCSWDGGFLPTEGEWEFAAAGGSDEREYPWGVSAPTSDVAVFAATGTAGVGSASLGAGRWGQLDLAGNVWEWTADYFASAFGGSCNNCVGSVPSDSRAIRGASFIDSASRMRVVDRVGYPQPVRSPLQGFRCARSP
jgi:formylglycine-generating enzyme required for sulfatase activity